MKRYPKYKDSGVEWIGEIPENWKVLKIKRLTLIKRGASPRPIDDPKYFDENGEFSWVRIADVTASERYLKQTTQTLSELGSSLSVKRYPGDFFVSIAGSVGKPIITKIKCCIHDGFVWFPYLNINSEFLYYMFSAGELYKGLGKWGTQLNLNTETIGDIHIPLPLNSEIENVVNYLDHKTHQIDNLVEKRQKQIELLKEQRTAIINHAVTKGLNPNVKMKDSGIEWIGEIPEHWKVKPLKFIGEIVLGKMLTNEDKGGYFKKPYLRAQNIIWEKVSINDVKEMWFSEYELHKYRLKENDLLVSEGGEVGRTAIWKKELDECYIQNSVHKVSMKQGNNPYYYLYHCQIYGKKGYFDSIVNRVSIAHLTREKLKDVKFLSPPSVEQKSIAKNIIKKTNEIDSLIKKYEYSIESLKEYRTTLISDAVTGKIDVREYYG